MVRRSVLALCAALVAVSLPARAEPDPDLVAELSRDLKGASDNPITGRYEGAVLVSQIRNAFDELVLPSGAAEGQTYDDNKKFSATVTATGKVTRSLYVAPQGRSALEVFANHVDAVTRAGFTPVFQCANEACGPSFGVLRYNWNNPKSQVRAEGLSSRAESIVKGMFDQVTDLRYALMKRDDAHADSYVAIYVALNSGGSFGNVSDTLRGRAGALVEVVEPRAMERKIVTVTAEEIGGKLGSEGRVAFYGIQFDFDKAEIKPESEPQLAEMARFLTENPSVAAYVVGHTDNKGTLDYNLTLSQKRAEAIVKALAGKHRIDARRLTPKGLGPLAPLASNADEDGQARNRRVELVQK